MAQTLILRLLFLVAMAAPFIGVSGQYNPESNSADFTITRRILSIEDGLASHEVFCGLQDQAGFIWFGTRNGLNRFDGRNCLLFSRQKNKLQENKVVQLAKDDANNLFIEYGSTGFQLATNGKIDVMNMITQEVKTLSAAYPDMPFKEQDVYWISNDGTDEVNFLTAHPFRLWKYSTKKGFRLRYQMTDWDTREPGLHTGFRSTGPLCLFAKGKALVKSHNRSTQYLITDGNVTSFVQQDALRSLPLGFDRQGNLLITYNTSAESDAFNIGMVTKPGAALFPAQKTLSSTDSIKGRYWYQAVCASDGASSILNIPTDALYLWNENSFLKIISKAEIKSFENLFLYQVLTDSFGNLWICTSAGVLQLKIEKNRFKQYFTGRLQSAVSNSQARGIYADGQGNLFANIWTHTFQQSEEVYKSTGGQEEIKYALALHHSSLYTGGYNLFQYDYRKNTLSRVPGGSGSEIWSMYSLNDSMLLLGKTDGFSLFNSSSKRFDSLRYADVNTEAAKFVYRFFKDNSDTIWAVSENGLYKIIRTSARFPGQRRATYNDQWTIIKETIPHITSSSLLDAYADKEGIFWLATNGEGLYRWNKKENTFLQFNIANGMPSDVLYRIEPDEYDNIWLSSDYGLIRFNKKNFSLNTYTTINGISHNEFNRTSSFKGKDGRLYFGGIDGVNAFYPKDFITDTGSLNVPLRIIAFNQFDGRKNQLINKTSDLLDRPAITLNPTDKFFTLEFRLLDFETNGGQRYAYKIDGLDKDWIYINENSVRISGLPYGNFTLHIKAQNREGAWSKQELKIPVLVIKPFYFRWWFISLLVFLLVLAIYYVIKIRTKQLAKDKSKLEQTVSDRTTQLKKSLNEQEQLLAEKDVLLKEIHHRVKNNLQVISGLLELQAKTLGNEIARDALQDGRSRVRSIALIHQNLYQFENMSSIELKRFATDLCRQIDSVFKKQNNVSVNIIVPVLYLDIDSAVPLGLIMNELLSNSFKYAFDDGRDGKINLEIRRTGEGRFQLLYSDNGPGLPGGFDLKHVTTLGMQLIYDLSRQIGGNVVYEFKNGASFIITFTNRDLRKKHD